MCIPKIHRDEEIKPIIDQPHEELLALLDDWHENFVDPAGIYYDEEEEYNETRSFVPDWQETDRLITGIEGIIKDILDRGIAIPENLLNEYQSTIAQYREYRLLPREAYPRLADHQYHLINLTINVQIAQIRTFFV
uniref:Uncharacterized protein n=1 Tax=Anopheles culicifacies TaxID=139723 RepID=A0A182M2W7_9DIPT